MNNLNVFVALQMVSQGKATACRRAGWVEELWIWPDKESDSGLLGLIRGCVVEIELAPSDYFSLDWLIIKT